MGRNSFDRDDPCWQDPDCVEAKMIILRDPNFTMTHYRSDSMENEVYSRFTSALDFVYPGAVVVIFSSFWVRCH